MLINIFVTAVCIFIVSIIAYTINLITTHHQTTNIFNINYHITTKNMEINDQTDVVFLKNCGRALTQAHAKFQQIVSKVVESASKIVSQFNKHSVQPYIKTIRERLEKEMENGNKPCF